MVFVELSVLIMVSLSFAIGFIAGVIVKMANRPINVNLQLKSEYHEIPEEDDDDDDGDDEISSLDKGYYHAN